LAKTASFKAKKRLLSKRELKRELEEQTSPSKVREKGDSF
jgi:hypothetical protein